MEAENQKNPRCTVESDLELLRRYQNGDERALADLMDGHFGLIYFWVGKLLSTLHWANREDLRQEGCIGFIEAAKKFDVSTPEDFHRHARVSVMAAIYRSREVRRVKRTRYKNYREVMKAHDILMRELERMPTLEELAKKTKLSKRQVDNALNVIAFPVPLKEADELFEVEDPYQWHLTEYAINQLTPREAEVIILYYFSGPSTDREIAEKLGKSEDAVKMARTRALKKLRKIFGRDERDGT